MGISFYTLTLLGYLFDVYYEIGPVQRNYGRLLLFGCYFPTMISGPIMKYSDMEKQMYTGHKLDYRNVTFGMQRILLGFSKNWSFPSGRRSWQMKFLTTMKSTAAFRSGWVRQPLRCSFTPISMVVWILCWVFPSVSVSGCRKNFSAPFLSRSIEEYWRRWHISLGDWLKNYLFYPLLRTKFFMNLPKKLKGKLGKKGAKAATTFLAMLILWFTIGYWHGGCVDVYHRLRSAALVLYRFRQADGAAVCKVESLFSYRKGKERIYPVSARAHLFPCHDRTCLFQKRRRFRMPFGCCGRGVSGLDCSCLETACCRAWDWIGQSCDSGGFDSVLCMAYDP